MSTAPVDTTADIVSDAELEELWAALEEDRSVLPIVACNTAF